MIFEWIGSICNEIGYFLATTIISIPILFLLNRIQKLNQVSKISLRLIKWLFIICSLLQILYWSMIYFDIGQGYIAEQIAFYDRAFGGNIYPYLIFQFVHIIVPLFLLVPFLGRSFIFVFIVSFLINIGLYIDRWIIIFTSELNSFLSPHWIYNYGMSAILWIMQGFVYLLILLIISRFIIYFKVKRQSKYK